MIIQDNYEEGLFHFPLNLRHPPMRKTPPNPDPTEVINPGISPPLVGPPRLIPRVNPTTPHRMEPLVETPIPTPRAKPTLPSKPTPPKGDSSKQQQGISSEMESDEVLSPYVGTAS